MHVQFTSKIIIFHLIFSLCNCQTYIYSQTHDTTALKAKVFKLKTPEDHKNFWDEMEFIDQTNYARASDSLKERVLLLTCMYINRYGYPNEKICGPNGNIARIVWVHAKYPEIEQHCFPIVNKGFLAGAITSDEFHDYFIGGNYSYEYDQDEVFNSTSPKELIPMLKLNTNDQIDLNHLITLFNYYHRFEKEKLSIIHVWQTKTPLDTLISNGFVLPRGGDLIKVPLFKHENGKFYSSHLEPAKPYPCFEIEFMDNEKTRFRRAGYKGKEYFEIDPEGNLIWNQRAGNILSLKKIR